MLKILTKIVTLTLLCTLWTPLAFAAIAVGSLDEVSPQTLATETTGSITVSGSNTLGLVFISDGATGSSITSVTWNGVAMSFATSTDVVSQGKDYIYCIVGPTTGAASVTRGANNNVMSIKAIYYTGVNQSCTFTSGSGFDAGVTNVGKGGATVTTQFTPTASNSWAISYFRNDSGSVSLSSGATLRGTAYNTGFGLGLADSNGTVTGGSPVSVVWNSFNNPGVNWSWTAFNIVPPVVAAPPSPFKLLSFFWGWW